MKSLSLNIKRSRLITNKFLIKKDISKFASNISELEIEQGKLLDLKVDFQKLTEKWLAYFRTKSKYSKYTTDKDLAFFLDIIKTSKLLHVQGKSTIKLNNQNK